jgi:hypothetical protein
VLGRWPPADGPASLVLSIPHGSGAFRMGPALPAAHADPVAAILSLSAVPLLVSAPALLLMTESGWICRYQQFHFY